ncbi:MAG: DUF1059 domain-containing protein [Deltaproteobacteria bacterium]|nr:DUF1059 domain-containing protein [Deltaproteobacteria bacterium]
MTRKVSDCRRMPSDSNCSLTISGEEDEVIQASVEHAVSVHGERDTPELRRMIREGLEEEPSGMDATLVKARESLGPAPH